MVVFQSPFVWRSFNESESHVSVETQKEGARGCHACRCLEQRIVGQAWPFFCEAKQRGWGGCAHQDRMGLLHERVPTFWGGGNQEAIH